MVCLRDECLNENAFTSLAAVRRIFAAWQLDYNTVRPHSGFGRSSPAAYASRPNPGQRGPNLTCPRPENGEQVIRAKPNRIPL